MPIQVGDRVELVTESPYMTVERVEGGKVHCVWFPSNSQPAMRDQFPEAALRVSSPKSPPQSGSTTAPAASKGQKGL